MINSTHLEWFLTDVGHSCARVPRCARCQPCSLHYPCNVVGRGFLFHNACWEEVLRGGSVEVPLGFSMQGLCCFYALTSEGRCCCASSQLISSIIAIGGIPGLCLRLVAAKANALSKLRMRLRLDSALYHAAPLRDFPRSLGMVRAAACSAVSLPGCDGGRNLKLNRMNTARVQFTSPLFISAITHHAVVPAEAIKAGLLLLWLQVQIPRARGLIDGRCLVQFMCELMFKGRFAG
jgi:hypothetical protein